ncbi:MAG: hypothetical protein LBB54_02770 [Cellulomonadaceae bacterium]|jgi:hypothetical protein|nr:hypothetical protein [Cellulomonadaceae bacterium]
MDATGTRTLDSLTACRQLTQGGWAMVGWRVGGQIAEVHSRGGLVGPLTLRDIAVSDDGLPYLAPEGRDIPAGWSPADDVRCFAALVCGDGVVGAAICQAGTFAALMFDAGPPQPIDVTSGESALRQLRHRARTAGR